MMLLLLADNWPALILLVTIGSPHVRGSTEHCSADGECGNHNAWQAGRPACRPERFGWDSFVCACTGSTCDFPGSIKHNTDPDAVITVTSSRDAARFAVSEGRLATAPADGSTIVRINPDIKYQTMLGFGGGFTDSTGMAIRSLSKETQDTLVRSYFAPEGIDYNLGRIPIAGSDFSTRPYSYDETDGDVNLTQFALAREDLDYKLPIVAHAASVKGDPASLLYLASPWSPPAWMKTNGKHHGSGQVKRELWQVYSNYIVKFLDAYKAAGVPIWCLATQNEPLCSDGEEWPFNACLWRAEDMRDWIIDSLGPTLRDEGHQNIKLIINDQVREHLQEYAETILLDQRANQFVSGVSVHWYTDDTTSPDILSKIQVRFPDKFLLYTEACTGYDASAGERVKMGDWGRAEDYATSIIESTTHYSTGWVDWNMALDMQGGPNWANNFVDSPIIVDKSKDTFYKQPMFYAMGHFSKFVERGYRAVYTSLMATKLQTDVAVQMAAFTSEDGRAVVVLLNTSEEQQLITVDPGSSIKKFINLRMPPKSIQTVLFTY